jgi:predicted nucleic acid-binding protein
MEKSKIIFDTDCLSSFLWVQEERLLTSLFDDRIFIPDAVVYEINNLKDTKHGNTVYQRFQEMVSNKLVNILPIEVGTPQAKLVEDIKTKYLNEYNQTLGNGELHMIALAIHLNAAYVTHTASNNLKDISSFIEDGSITNITTMDILCHAMKKSLKTLPELEKIKNDMLIKKRRLPDISIENYYKENYTKKWSPDNSI